MMLCAWCVCVCVCVCEINLIYQVALSCYIPSYNTALSRVETAQRGRRNGDEVMITDHLCTFLYVRYFQWCPSQLCRRLFSSENRVFMPYLNATSCECFLWFASQHRSRGLTGGTEWNWWLLCLLINKTATSSHINTYIDTSSLISLFCLCRTSSTRS